MTCNSDPGAGDSRQSRGPETPRRNRPVIVIGGPTASGKSALATAVVREFGGVVVNADSMQLYRDLRVLTARPTPAEEAAVPHRLYGVLDGAEAGSVGRWLGMAKQALEAPGIDGPAVLVGGTGLYLGAALDGLTRLPAVPPAVRAAAEERLAAIGATAFHAMLAERDPEAGDRLVPSDRQRLVRAWSVIEATGRSLYDWQRSAAAEPPLAASALVLLLLPPRAALHAACDQRFRRMVDEGAIEEVEALRARGLAPDLPVMKAVGVREIGVFLDGEANREAMIEAGRTATRRYAKRQYTWFRNRMPPAHGAVVLGEQFSKSLAKEIFPKIRHFLLTASN